jgi:hypothetical protein
VDLVEMAVGVLTGWLALRDATTAERKRELARVYIGEALSKFRGRMAAIQACDPAPLQARYLVLTESP